MLIFWVILGIFVYFFLVFFILRLVVPFMGFGGYCSPADLPPAIKQTIADLESSSPDQKAYLQAAYNFVTSHWHAGRMDTVYKASLAFRKNLAKIWQQPGYAHCNIQNYILYVLLTKSKFFTEQDVKIKSVFFNFFIHQYLKVNISGKWTDADPAGSSIRAKALGHHLSWFG